MTTMVNIGTTWPWRVIVRHSPERDHGDRQSSEIIGTSRQHDVTE